MLGWWRVVLWGLLVLALLWGLLVLILYFTESKGSQGHPIYYPF